MIKLIEYYRQQAKNIGLLVEIGTLPSFIMQFKNVSTGIALFQLGMIMEMICLTLLILQMNLFSISEIFFDHYLLTMAEQPQTLICRNIQMTSPAQYQTSRKFGQYSKP